MTREGCSFFVIPNLFRDLGSGFRFFKMLVFLKPYEYLFVGMLFIAIGILALVKEKIGIENTDYIIKGMFARIIGILLIALGIVILLFVR